MNKRISILAIELPLEVHLLRAIMAVLLCAAACYLYFVSASVLNIMARKGAVDEAAKLQSAIGVMEREYFALGEELSPEEASSIGLAPLAETSYVYRPGNAAQANTADTIQRNAI